MSADRAAFGLKLIFGLGIAGRAYALPLAIGLGVPVLAGAAVVPFLFL